MSLAVAEDWPKQRSNPARHLPHRVDKQGLSGRLSADQRLFPTRRKIGMYESQAFKALNLKASRHSHWARGLSRPWKAWAFYKDLGSGSSKTKASVRSQCN